MLRKRQERITGKRPDTELRFPKSKYKSSDLFEQMGIKGLAN
jgi:hypothetical protein